MKRENYGQGAALSLGEGNAVELHHITYYTVKYKSLLIILLYFQYKTLSVQ